MNITELHTKLKEAYSNQNLNKISVTLINLYKSREFDTLSQIAEMINETVQITIDPRAKYFSKLMMLYHPDRGDYHRNEIDRLAEENNFDGLLSYAHILLLGKIEEIAVTLANYEDIDYSPVYEWDFDEEWFTIVEPTQVKEPVYHSKKRNRQVTFFDAIKLRQYGDTGVDFPVYYLEDIEEFELSQSQINDLEGVQYCKHAIMIDLSGNLIADITCLWGLALLEELNLSDNKIEDIDTLSNLKNLRIIDLSNNSVKDISPLMNLNRLEYVDLTGTKASKKQIAELKEQGVTVVI